jgi:hypothetical protein
MNRDYVTLSTTREIPDLGITVTIHYPITGSDSIEIMSNKTQKEIVSELTGLASQLSEAQRIVFRAIGWVQAQGHNPDAAAVTLLSRAKHHLQEHASDYNHPGQPELVAEIEAFLNPGQALVSSAAASAASARTTAATALNQHPAVLAAEAASQSQAAPAQSSESVFIPQLNTQETIDAARRAAGKSPLAAPAVADALDQAKDVLRGIMVQNGIPDNVIKLVDRVKPEDLHKHKGPTEAVDGPTEAEQESNVLSAFVGVGSIFVEKLSPEVIFNGRGLIAPKFVGAAGPIKRYKEDAKWLAEHTLREWPTGFYLNRDTKVSQFLVNTDQAAFLVDGLPSEVAPVEVYVYGSNDGWRKIQDFMLSEQKLFHAKLEDALNVIVKKKG